MIVVHGMSVVHLGGWRGDRLHVCSEATGFRVLADLGWDADHQVTPQRRLLVADPIVVVGEVLILMHVADEG